MWRTILAALIFSMLASVGVAACSEDSVSLRGDWGQARFRVEIADTTESQRIGLMNRSSMSSSAGMLFVYPAPRPLSFWMRNTLIELDMLFIDSRGVVTHIHHRAQPLDETPISGGIGIAVLEINGGLAKSMGISVGSEVKHPSFEKGAAWSC